MALEYQTITADDSSDLDELVNKNIAEGWEPLGGVTLARWEEENTRKGYTDTGFMFVQAMIRKTDVD